MQPKWLTRCKKHTIYPSAGSLTPSPLSDFQVLCYPVEEEENMETPTGSKKSKDGSKDKKDAKGKVSSLGQGHTETLTSLPLGPFSSPGLSLFSVFCQSVVIAMVTFSVPIMAANYFFHCFNLCYGYTIQSLSYLFLLLLVFCLFVCFGFLFLASLFLFLFCLFLFLFILSHQTGRQNSLRVLLLRVGWCTVHLADKIMIISIISPIMILHMCRY